MYKHEQGIPMKIGNNRPLRGSVLAGVVGVLLLCLVVLLLLLLV